MATLSSPLGPQPTRRGRSITILLLICAGIGSVPFLLAALVAFAFHIPYMNAMFAFLTLFGVASFALMLAMRLHGFIARGPLVADAGKEPRRKLFGWLAAITLILGIGIVESMRREAEIAAVRDRIQQLIELRRPIQSRKITLLERQLAMLKNVPPDVKEARDVGQLVQHEQDESDRLGKLIESELAKKERVAFQVLPDWSEIQQSLTDLRNGLGAFPSHPWDDLASKLTFQMYLCSFAIASGLITMLIAIGHRQVCENGIWQVATLVRWKHIGSYHWENDTLVAQIGNTQSSISLPIAPADKTAVTDLLALKLAAKA